METVSTEEWNASVQKYGNFDIIFDHFSRISWPCTALLAPWNTLYEVPMRIGC